MGGAGYEGSKGQVLGNPLPLRPTASLLSSERDDDEKRLIPINRKKTPSRLKQQNRARHVGGGGKKPTIL